MPKSGLPDLRPLNDEQGELFDSLGKNKLTVCRSKLFGSGKTFCTIGYAAGQLDKGNIDKVVFCRDTTAISDKLGFMPGTRNQKLFESVKFAESYFKAFLGKRFDKLRGDIEYQDISELAGKTYTNTLMVLDEASNCPREDIEMFISRAGWRTRCVILGTDRQISHNRSFFSQMFQRLRGIPNVGLVSLKEVCRNDWMTAVLNAFDVMDD